MILISCIVLSHRLVCARALTTFARCDICYMEVNMLLTANLKLMSGVVFGAAAVMVMKQVCKRKRRKKHQEAHAPVATSE